MKRKIEVEVELPSFLDDDFLELLSRLSPVEVMTLKAFIDGMLWSKNNPGRE